MPSNRGIDVEPLNRDGDVMTPAEAAAFLKIGRSKLYELAAELKIPCLRLGARTLRFRRVALLEHLAAIERGGAGNGGAR